MLDGLAVVAGHLFSHRRQNRESASFAYEAAYIGRSDAYALDPSLPLAQGAQHTPDGIAMFRAFTDAAPDRWGRTLIRRRERERAAAGRATERSLGEIDFLLGVRDDLRQGAIRFRDLPDGHFLASEEGGVETVTELPRLLAAADRYEADDESVAELHDLIRVGSSLAARDRKPA